MDIVKEIEKELIPSKRKIDFEVGNTVKVHYRIVEGDKERIQIYEGIVIAIDNSGINKTFTVRKISFDIGVERIFPFYSAKIAEIEVLRKGKVRRSKLYFLRERRGKSAKLKERVKKVGLKGKRIDVPEIVGEPTQVDEPKNQSEEVATK